MTRAVSFSLAPLVLAMLVFGAGCEGNPVGRTCFIGSDAGVGGVTIVSSPAVECQSKICLHYVTSTIDMCTGFCESDDDCDRDSATECEKGFTCMVTTVVGPYCCRKMCVCQDFLTDLHYDGGIPVEPLCDPSVGANSCCNLAGRRDDPQMYPTCQ